MFCVLKMKINAEWLPIRWSKRLKLKNIVMIVNKTCVEYLLRITENNEESSRTKTQRIRIDTTIKKTTEQLLTAL